MRVTTNHQNPHGVPNCVSALFDAYMQCIYTMIVDITLTLRGQSFEWEAEKAASNFAKHGVAFPEACEVFFDPFFHLVRWH